MKELITLLEEALVEIERRELVCAHISVSGAIRLAQLEVKRQWGRKYERKGAQ